jgi:hypothetical protein
MPPGHPQQSGDVLDRALAAARTNPSQTPAGNAFFHAVAGTRSPINRQSSRIAKPFATQPFLGGGNNPTVATPAEQAFLGRTNATDKTAPAPVRQQGAHIAREYVKAADTQRTVEKPQRAAHGIGGPVEFGLTAPNITAQATRALGLLGSGVGFGSVAPTALNALSKAGLPNVERQQVIGGFAKDTSLDTPQAKATLVALALAKHNTIPANPTTRQLLTAALSPHEHHASYWDAVNPENIVKDALYTPVYAAEGGYALGHATRAAIGGNPAELEAIGKSQLQTVEHPGAYLQQHPFQAALTIAAPIKGLGKLGGLATGAEATPRLVALDERLGGGTLDRGDYSTNLIDRAAQQAADRLVTKSPTLQARNIAAGTRREGNLARIESAHAMRPIAEGLAQASKGISKSRRSALLANEANGGTPAEWSAHYDSLASHSERVAADDTLEPKVRAQAQKLAKTQRAQANLRAAQAKRWPGPLKPNEQAYVDAARNASDARTKILTNTKTPAGNTALNMISAKWRDYQHNVELRAGQGDPLAKSVVTARNALNTTEPGTPEYETALSHLGRQLDAYEVASPEQPFRVPTIKPKLVSEFGSPGNPLRANTNPANLVTGLKHSTGGALESGNYITNSGRFARQIVQPHTLQAAINYVNRVSTRFGRPAIANESIPEGMILRNVSNLRTTPKVNLTAESELEHQASDLAKIHDEFKVDDEGNSTLSHVPANARPGDFILLPKAAYEEITKTVERAPRKGTAAGVAKATRVYKNSVLFTRPAFPASNFVNSGLQAGVGGVGPASFLRRNAIEFPPGVEDAGFVASDLTPSAREGFRSAVDEAKVAPGAADKTGAILRGGGRVVNEQYLNRIKRASISADNVWRKALYVKKALPEARKLAYPEESTIKRLLVRKSASDGAIQDAARAMAHGTTEEAKRAADRALKATNDFLGDFGAMRRYPALDLAVPFNSWMRFSGKLLLYTLPVKYPGRTALLYRLGQLGQQGTSQQGVLPQYLQESIPFGGANPLSQGIINTQRANSFATLGSVAPLGDQGGISTEQVFGNASPFLAPLIEAATGNDLQTGRAIKDAQGNPIKGNPSDLARFALNQVAGFVPPIGLASTLFEGGRKPSQTSVPFLGFQGKPTSKAGPLLQQPQLPAWETIANLLAPVHFGQTNLHADQYYGNKDLRTGLAKENATANKKAAKQPGGVAKIVANATRISDELNKNEPYYETHPAALKALLKSGTKK